MGLLGNFHSAFSKTVIPIHSYQDYTSETLENIHTADQWLPALSFIYILCIFLIYLYQTCSRINKFDPKIIPIHHMGIICLLMSMIYIALLFIEAHTDTIHIKIFKSCLTTQRVHLIALVIVKYFTTWIFIFNLSYMNQSPFFNPRYKYITKKRRKFLHFLFLGFKWIIGIFLPIGIFSAYQRANYDSFNGDPNNYKYCYMTFNLRNFFVVFGTDILGIILYGLLFGRNACKLTRRKIKKHKHQSDVNPNDLKTSSQYDLDDPIQKTLLINSTDNNNNYNPTTTTNTNNLIEPLQDDDNDDEFSHSMTTTHTESDSLSSDEDRSRNNIGSRNDGSRNNRSRRGSLSASGTVSRESSIISGAEDNVKLQEQNGVRELVRVLRLIWFMFIFYWINVLLYVFLGLYTSSASIALVINATCILLLNDYEFSSTYWSIRSSISMCFCWCCIIGCGCWFGQRKYSIQQFMDQYDDYYYDDDTVYSYESKQSSKEASDVKQYIYHEIDE